MQFVLFGFLLLLPLFQTCDARDVYTSVWWWDHLYSHAKNKSISVRLNSQLYFICPNKPTVVKKRVNDRQTPTMYENIWLTDNETYYENCEIGENPQDKVTEVFLCNQPVELSFLIILFLEHAAGLNDRTYEGGKHYYFLSTSDGRESSIHSKKGGHCQTHNMRLKVYVCNKTADANPDCADPDPQLNDGFIIPPYTPVPLTTLLTTPVTDPVTTTRPAKTNTETVMTNATDKVPVIISDTDADEDTETVMTTATEIIPTDYDRSVTPPIQLIWEISYNRTQTAFVFEGRNYPVVALCNEPNTKISQLNDKGKIVDSWLCQKAGERQTILKPEYRNGEVYLFEASPEFSRIRVWKSTLSVNVGSFKTQSISAANTLYNLPTLALLASMYLLTGSAF